MITKPLSVSLILCALMLASAGMTKALTPTAKQADSQPRFNLDAMIPSSFAEWQVDTSVVPLKLDPEVQAKLDKLYNQTVTRTYINRDGSRVMLSIAYGGDQSEGLGLHRPEVCYAAQGFSVESDNVEDLGTAFGRLPVKRLMAVSGERREPISYWITIGSELIKPGIGQKLAQIRLGLTGTVPDGMLVRVSSIGADRAAGYRLQDKFVNDLLNAVSQETRTRLIGAPGV